MGFIWKSYLLEILIFFLVYKYFYQNLSAGYKGKKKDQVRQRHFKTSWCQKILNKPSTVAEQQF